MTISRFHADSPGAPAPPRDWLYLGLAVASFAALYYIGRYLEVLDELEAAQARAAPVVIYVDPDKWRGHEGRHRAEREAAAD